MQDIVLQSFETKSGVKYTYFRTTAGNFCISRNGKVFYKGFAKAQAERQLESLKNFLRRGNQLSEGGEQNGTTDTTSK